MLATFGSVGAESFDLTLTDAVGRKVSFRPNRRIDVLRRDLPDILHQAVTLGHNVIVRPRPTGPALIQLDDLGEDAVIRLRPLAFLVLRTSSANFQVWLAVADADSEFARRLRKGAGADLTASGATRVSGSLNFKEKYTAGGYPTVETIHAHPGRIVTRSELEALGVVSAPETAASPPVKPPQRYLGARGWPDYQRCLRGAPTAHAGGRPDVSRCDFTWCLTALDWGFGVEETASRLLEESGKAQAEGERYALRTVQNAAAALERRRGAGR